jgi:hypothetical protein
VTLLMATTVHRVTWGETFVVIAGMAAYATGLLYWLGRHEGERAEIELVESRTSLSS